MQLIKERSFQGLLGSGVITMEGWHCFERDNTEEGQGGGNHPVTPQMADGLPEPFSELLTIWTSVTGRKNIFFRCLCFYFFPSSTFYGETLLKSSNGERLSKIFIALNRQHLSFSISG